MESLRVQGHWKDYFMPMWYADAGSEEQRKEILNRIPKLGNVEKSKPKDKVVSIAVR